MDLLVALCFLLLVIHSQLTSADSSIDTEGEKGDSSNRMFRGDADFRINHGLNQQDILRLLIMAAQHSRAPNNEFRGNSWGIPYRPVRRIGSEFLGKRSDIPAYYDNDEEEAVEKRRMGSEFLGKRGMGSEFLGKRGMGSEFLGKRRMGSEFLGKRRMGSEFLGKRGMGSEFLGKRGMGSEFLGKRGMGSEFLGKRRMGSEFLGKRGMGSEFLGKRRMGSEFLGKRRMGSEFLGKRRMGSEFLGKRDYDPELDSDLQELPQYMSQTLVYPQQQQLQDGEKTQNLEDSNVLYSSNIGKRALGPEILGKRKQANGYEYSWKRGRLGSEFLGKRSVVPEQPFTYFQTENYDLDTPFSMNFANSSDAKGTMDLAASK